MACSPIGCCFGLPLGAMIEALDLVHEQSPLLRRQHGEPTRVKTRTGRSFGLLTAPGHAGTNPRTTSAST